MKLRDRPRAEGRVLIVDDDDIVCAQLQALLRKANLDVVVAGSGEDALRVLRRGGCHVVLTDWQLPGIDGPELCRLIRADPCCCDVHIVMFTARDCEGDRRTGLAAGADDFVTKGLPAALLLERVKAGLLVSHLEYSQRKGHRVRR